MSAYITTLLAQYDALHWRCLTKPQLTPDDIYPVMQTLARLPGIKLTLLGHSYAGRPIYQLEAGSGDVRIMGWTQMHGDESTATAAVLDWFHILGHQIDAVAPTSLLQRCRLCFIVMLNPDGALANTRRNAQGIDINRDARALQTPEGALLMQQVKRFAPHLAFNLHDQNAYYRAGHASHAPATLSFFAPPFDASQGIDDKRDRAMHTIASLYQMLSVHFDAGIARYVDAYSARCFGDTIARLCSTILIESGAYLGDPCRQTARKMNVAALHYATLRLTGTVDETHPPDYFSIPENIEDGMCDLLLRHVQLGSTSYRYFADVSINRIAEHALITDVGDLKERCGFTELACDDWQLLADRPYRVHQPLTLTDTVYKKLLRQGYNRLIDSEDLLTVRTSLPVVISRCAGDGPDAPDTLRQNIRPALIFTRHDTPCIAVADCTVIRL
ncbi:M14 family zinc carboxypeptidase [Salinimonas chungwhensis]|uniref:M14 family zinc carboxypeptidase n=1 Tax=Salinimonas chungwhensis TaxID=265425 RepID=UPI00036B8FF8|nr:M14 family zinc carboxypeptidase [Salinimonas chungwhensis]